MDPSVPDFSSGKSPRRELQGPRPTPLRVSKDSHKIRKPPIAPPPQHPSQPPPHHQPRPPVIIYTVSPKVIHTEPSEFMTLVQRLTGSGSSGTSSSSSSSYLPDSSGGGAISPAARFASIEKTKSPEKKIKPQGGDMGVEISTEVERTGSFPGILSPGPASLPPIPASFFSPPADPNPLGFFHDLSPVFQGNKNYLETSFMPSPSNLTSFMPSPSYFLSPNTPSLDFFNNFFDS